VARADPLAVWAPAESAPTERQAGGDMAFALMARISELSQTGITEPAL